MKVYIENKSQKLILEEKVIKKIVKSVLKLEGQPTRQVACGVFFVGKEEMQALNKEYREKDKPTDVITFRLIDFECGKILNKKNFEIEFDKSIGGLYLGEIFICVDIAEEQAIEWKHSALREMAELLVHGMLHILGNDHEEEDMARIMKEKEVSMYPILDKIVR